MGYASPTNKLKLTLDIACSPQKSNTFQVRWSFGRKERLGCTKPRITDQTNTTATQWKLGNLFNNVMTVSTFSRTRPAFIELVEVDLQGASYPHESKRDTPDITLGTTNTASININDCVPTDSPFS